MGVFDYRRRESHPVKIGNTPLGGDNPVRVQSMTSTSTMDTEGSARQAAAIIDAGGEYVRLTAQGVREAANLAAIKSRLREMGYDTPLVADIHFNPKAAEEAALWVEKVRINPGNFVDPGRTFKKLEYTDEEYVRELDRIEQRLVPFIELCRKHDTAIRIGVNHGSLSDRIMSRYGDTPAGMTESAMEFLRVFRRHGFDNVVISIKASNTVVMVETVRRLVAAMDAESMHYPLHLGVTEAGNGEDGRVKSAVGIGALLHQGIGDTIRVSLSEAPEAEIPVAKTLVNRISALSGAPAIEGDYADGFDPVKPSRRNSREINGIGGSNPPAAIGVDTIDKELLREVNADLDDDSFIKAVRAAGEKIIVLHTAHPNAPAKLQSKLHLMMKSGLDNPVITRLSYPADITPEDLVIAASADAGAILLNGFHDGIEIDAPGKEVKSLSLAILQAARLRFSHTDYISCPGCGRTMFDLQRTVDTIKKATSHLPSLKIGVMGCIVNGPGEMADADYGYVGAAAGRVSLYRGKECIEKNIPESEALDRLVALIKADGRWTDPDTDTSLK